MPPLSPQLQAHREQDGAEAGYLDLVGSLRKRHPRLTVLDGRHSGYDHTLFVDATHLDGHGAAALSVEVAEVLHRDLEPGSISQAVPLRWVTLPPYRTPPSPIALEDVEQSRRIVRAGAVESRIR